jgi:hypothetical protein
MQELSKAAVEDAFRALGEILARAGKRAAVIRQFAERLNAPLSDDTG